MASVARAVPPPLFTNSAAPTTRGSRNQRTPPFNLKACSSCKKGRTTAIKCRVDLRHWEDPDWTDPPSRRWVMPEGFVEWVAKVDGGPNGRQPGSPMNRATAAAAAAFRQAVLANKATSAGSGAGRRVAGSGAGRRVAVTESTSTLLDRMLGAAALPPPPPAPVARAPVPAPRTAPGAPALGGGGMMRTRCLTEGCSNPVGRDVAFCSGDCVVAAQKQAVQALVAFHQKQQAAAVGASAAAGAGVIPKKSAGVIPKKKVTAAVGAGAAAGAWVIPKKKAAAANGGGRGGDGGGSVGGDAAAAVEGGSGGAGGTGGSGGGGGGKKSGGSTAGGEEGKNNAASPKWTAEDEEGFTKGLEALRARSAQTSGQRLRHKVMDLFRELFAEGMAELGVGSGEAGILSGVLAWDLEHELNAFSRTNRDVYKEKAKSLRFNVKFAKNPELFKDLLTGGTTMKTLCGMSTDELASSHLQEERKRIRDESYAGHVRQEDEDSEIVYKDGALQMIDRVKSEANKQDIFGAGSEPAGKGGGTNKAGGSKNSGGGGGGGGGGNSANNKRRRGSGDGFKTEGGGAIKKEAEDSGDSSDEVSGGGGGGGVRRSELFKRRLSASSDLGSGGGGGGDGDGDEGSATKRMQRLLAVGSPVIADVPKLDFPSAPLPDFLSSPLDMDMIPPPTRPGDDSNGDPDGGGSEHGRRRRR